jgi:hypothetical protein
LLNFKIFKKILFMNENLKKSLLLFIVVSTLAFIFTKDPIIQNLEYHNFSDKRPWLGINNFGDVFSNIAFIFVGLYGILNLRKYKPEVASLSWMVFFVGVTLVAPGSAWYHWNPNNTTLVLDRLPMTIAFMGLFTAMLSTYISPKYEKPLLPISLLFGFASVFVWHFTDDLRLYYFVQIAPLIVIPTVIILFKSENIKPSYLGLALLFYVLAKYVEISDSKIFHASSGMISGHTLKHLAAAIAPLLLIRMLQKVYLSKTRSRTIAL